MLLAGKTALITGAARGIGKSCAQLLASEGAAVGLADILPAVEETAAELREGGGRAEAAVFDIGDAAGAAAGVEKLRTALGGIDILVNNAGIVNNIAPLAKMSREAWDRELNTNLSGAFTMIGLVIGDMTAKGWGRIINISSVGATGGLHRQIGYAASKAGLLGLTKTVTLEHGRDGVTCNAILPGMVATENVLAMPTEIQEKLLVITPAGRFGKVEEVAHLVAFLASERAGYINGAEINIDGGSRLNSVSLGSRKANR